MQQYSKIIAVSGLKNSGKDTASEMMQYLLNAPKWARNYWCFKHCKFLGKFHNNYEIVSFATPLKKMLAVLLNVPVERFNDRSFKENYYVSFPEIGILHKDAVPSGSILTDNKFSRMAKMLDPAITENYWISVRQLMQFFGTNVMRTFFGDGLWTYATLKDKNIIISDLRFKVEMDIIKHYNPYTIYIQRDSCIPGSHASEQEVISMKEQGKYNRIIENNGSLKDLFYKLKKII